MSLASSWPVPYLIDPHHLAVDAVVSFCVAALLAITINAEAQAFAATFLGDARPSPKDRFHFNAFLHLDIIGTVCYLVGGFGWPRPIPVDPGKFRHPRLYTVITRFAGPLANLLLGSIAGSIVMFMKIFEYDPRVFLMVIGVNITTAVCSLIPLPPLAGGVLVYELLPPSWTTARALFLQSGPFAVLALVLLDRINHREIIGPYVDPVIVAIFNYIKG